MTVPPLPIDLKNPVMAGVLAFLCPGAGHFYQKRFFKAFVFAICIWGTWWTGMAMSDWKALQAPKIEKNVRLPAALKFGGQCGVGLPSLWAMWQSERYYSEGNKSPDTISGPRAFPFTGHVDLREPAGNRSGPVTGTLSLVPAQNDFGPAISGEFTGTLNQEPISLKLKDNVRLDQPVRAGRQLPVTGSVSDENGKSLGDLRGSIPRSLVNWFACPLDAQEEVEWHRERGKYQELAMVFVWVAGLMNLLAIWDAVEGPAYGINDEEPAPSPAPAA